MDIKVSNAIKWRFQDSIGYCVITDGQTQSGSLTNHPSINSAIKNTIKKISEKKISTPFETLYADKSPLLVANLTEQLGLDTKERYRVAASHILRLAKSKPWKTLIILLQSTSSEYIEAIIEGLVLSNYCFTKYKTTDKKPSAPISIQLNCDSKALKATKTYLADSQKISKAINYCRDFINEPGSNLGPVKFANIIKQLSKGTGLSVAIKSATELQKQGFNGLLTVGKGSPLAPCMVTLTYKGKGRATSTKAPHLVLVGKGVTFDTGGISLKPGSDMWEMKSDMSGAATVFATIYAIAQLKLNIKVSAVLTLAENRPGRGAVLPGDIFKAKNGKTIMVENTDAEGRLVLTDGLAQAGILKATHIVDVATLTGAIIRAIGSSMTGLFCNDDAFTDLIIQSGKTNGEKYWNMPLEAEYRSYLDDSVADLKNIGKPEAGAITAALFLKEFVPDNTIWAHLDIAGTAFHNRPWKYFPTGATGWGVRSLIDVAKGLAK